MQACVGVAAVKGLGAEESLIHAGGFSGMVDNILSAVVAGLPHGVLSAYFHSWVKSGGRFYGLFYFKIQNPRQQRAFTCSLL